MEKKIVVVLLLLCVAAVPAARAAALPPAEQTAAMSASTSDAPAPDPSPHAVRIAAVANGTLQTDTRSAAAGTIVNLTAIPAAGYTLREVTVRDDAWNPYPVEEVSGGGGAAYRFAMPPCPVFVSAVFSAPTYVISLAPVRHGKLSVLPMIAAKSSTVTISAYPERGYLAREIAAWDARGNRLSVTDNGDGTATFVMPGGAVEVSAEFYVERLQGFTDVWGTDWFFEDAKWAYEQKLILGVTETLWSPDEKISAATAVTTLARLANVNLEPYADDYYDYPWIPREWYMAAARWAAYEGFLTESVFTGRDPISRAGLAVILRGFLACQGAEVQQTGARFHFTDDAEVSALGPQVSEAFQILRQTKIFGGYKDGTIRPYVYTTRAQMATLLHRLSIFLHG